MATCPPADRNGLQSSKMYRTYMGRKGSAASSGYGPASKIVPKIPTSVNSIIKMSKPRICSFKIAKASTHTMIGDRLLTIEMIVSGIYLVTE